jgi:dUTP pyrophosphatase
MNIKIKLLHPRAIIPAQREGDAGADVHSIEEWTLYPGEMRTISLGIAIELPVGYVAFSLPRSGLSSQGFTIHTGTIDPAYRGEIRAIAQNASLREKWTVRSGDRIAQLVVVPHLLFKFDACSELGDTSRGANGFGSSGIRPISVDANGSPVRPGGNGG